MHVGGEPPEVGLVEESNRNCEYVKADFESVRIDGNSEKDDILRDNEMSTRGTKEEKDEEMFLCAASRSTCCTAEAMIRALLGPPATTGGRSTTGGAQEAMVGDWS